MKIKPAFIIYLLVLLFSLFALRSVGQPLVDTRICIDAGHGGHTGDDRQIFLPNGIVYWESEGDLTTAFHLKGYLENLGADVMLTRTDNSNESDISLSERSAIANAFGADFFHSIHTNGGGGTYSLVLYKEVSGNPAFPLAKEMGDIMAPYLQDLMKTVANYNRGDYSFLGFNLGVLNYANMPSTLSESSFHDLPEEGLRLKNSEYLKNYAFAIAKSFLSYFEVDGFPTGRVGGIIKDVTLGTVVNEVSVECLPIGTTYTGDNNYNGFYAIGALDPGEYQLVLSKEGYLNDTSMVDISANEYEDLDLTIQYLNNGFPNVDFYMVGLPAGAGEQITFNAGNSTDDGTIVTFSWDFGDGSPLDTGQIVHHSYNMDGSYEVMMTATDDEGNQSSIAKTLEIKTNPPTAPKLISVKQYNDNNGLHIQWQKSPETNITYYHVWMSPDPDFSGFIDVYTVGADTTELTIDNYGALGSRVYIGVEAQNVAFKRSETGDIYGFQKNLNVAGDHILIVDGFNRKGSYTENTHSFVTTYLEAIPYNEGIRVSSCSNSAISGNYLDLKDYDIVFWFLGDESTADETFSSYEQGKVKQYMEQGGKLFVTGAEIGWDLVAKGSANDIYFYQEYLKASYLADGGSGRAPASGISGSGFEGVDLPFGVVYPEDYPDEIGAFGGSSKILNYVTGAGAGVKYKGLFGDGDLEGAVVNIGFPLESVADQEKIDFFIRKLLDFFNTVPNTTQDNVQKQLFELYPTIVHNKLDLYYDLPSSGLYEFEIYSINGQKQSPGFRENLLGKSVISLPVQELKPGIYSLLISAEGTQQSIKFIIQ